MDEVEDDIAVERERKNKEKEKKRMEAKRTMRSLSSQAGYNAVAFDVDGDGIADTYGVDEDGDGVVDYMVSAEEMEKQQALQTQGWIEGESVEVYSNTADKWCKGEVKSVDGD